MNKYILFLSIFLHQFQAISQNFIFEIDTFRIKDCSTLDSLLANPQADGSNEMIEKCNHFYVEWPSISGSNWINERVQNQLREYTCGLIQSDQIDSIEYTPTMSNAFILKHNQNNSAEWSITCSNYPMYSGVYQFQISHGGYYYGAAHGFGYSRYFHFNDITGKEIGLEQLSDSFELTLLTNFTLRKLQQEMNHEWDDSISNDFFLTENFLLTNEGISFYYDAYEIGPYAMGYPEISLSWLEIEDCLSTK